MLKELYSKYLRKPGVQRGVASQVIKSTIITLTPTKITIRSDYINHVVYVSGISQEEKIQLYLKKPLIIQTAQKKLLEDFGINTIIKDIRLSNK